MIEPDITKISPYTDAGTPSGKLVVIHATRSGVSMNPSEFEGTINWLTGGSPDNLSIHWVLARDARTARLCVDTRRARHAGEHNWTAWGIEVCQGVESDGFTDVQMRKLAEICKGYVNDFGVPPVHTLDSNSQGFIGHEETAQGKRAGKSDPGRLFDWELFLRLLNDTSAPPEEEENDMKSHHAWAAWFNGRAIGGGASVYVVQARSDFALPADAAAILFQADLQSGSVEFLHGDSDIPVAKVGENVWVANLAANGTINMRTREGVSFRTLHCIGYYR